MIKNLERTTNLSSEPVPFFHQPVACGRRFSAAPVANIASSGWRNRTGSALWRTCVPRARRAKGCWPVFSWGATCCWSTTQAAWCVRARRESRRSCRASWVRLHTTAEFWEQRVRSLLGKPRLLGNYFSTSGDRLRSLATIGGLHHLDNAIPLTKRNTPSSTQLDSVTIRDSYRLPLARPK